MPLTAGGGSAYTPAVVSWAEKDRLASLRYCLRAFREATGVGVRLRPCDGGEDSSTGISIRNPLCDLLTERGTCACDSAASAGFAGNDGTVPRACRAGMLHCDVLLPDPRHPRYVLEVGGVFARPPTEAEARRWWRALSAGVGPDVRPRLTTAWKAVPVVNASFWDTALSFIRKLAYVTLCGASTCGGARGSEPGSLVDRAKAYVRDNLAEPISSRTAAEHVRVCLPHFCRVFRRATGLTFLRYVAEERLAQAKALLAESQRPITEVAFAAGFQSVWQFNHRFKAEVGVSPSAYRAHVRVEGSTDLPAPLP